ARRRRAAAGTPAPRVATGVRRPMSIDSTPPNRVGSDRVDSAPVVVERGVGRSFAGRSIYADLDLEIRADEFVALLGRSGTGKSTLLRALAGLDDGYTGSVQVPPARSVVFQEPRLLPWK